MRDELMALWERGWPCVFSAADPGCTITIRGEAHSVMRTINRQIAHYAYLAAHIAGSRYSHEIEKTFHPEKNSWPVFSRQAGLQGPDPIPFRASRKCDCGCRRRD